MIIEENAVRCYLYPEDDAKSLVGFEAVPICGVDFCDTCGDCLDCQEGECVDGNGCLWVIYLDDAEEFIRQHDKLSTRTINLIREAIKAN